jgi:hypothetical protein
MMRRNVETTRIAGICQVASLLVILAWCFVCWRTTLCAVPAQLPRSGNQRGSLWRRSPRSGCQIIPSEQRVP